MEKLVTIKYLWKDLEREDMLVRRQVTSNETMRSILERRKEGLIVEFEKRY